MRITVDGQTVELAAGMTVRHALLARYGVEPDGITVTDRWGNRLGLDGELHDGAVLKTETKDQRHVG